MAATLQRGYTFGSTETVTNTKLHTLVDGGTVTGISETDLASGKGLVVRSTSSPSNTNSIWVDTNFSTPQLKLYTGASWVPVGPYAILTNKSGSQRVAGDVVVANTSNDSAYTTSTGGSDATVLGVVMETTANNASGVVALPGALVPVTVDGSTTRGQFLKTSTTAAKATPTSTAGAGTFAIALTASSTSVTALLTGVANGLSALPAGSIVQVVSTQSGAVATGTTAIPNDDTIPQNTEGDEYMTLAITPTNASNKLLIQVVFNFALSTTAQMAVALFQDSTANALACAETFGYLTDAQVCVAFSHYMTAGTTSATTFKVRSGGTSGTLTFNGNNAARTYGGVIASSIRIWEIKV